MLSQSDPLPVELSVVHVDIRRQIAAEWLDIIADPIGNHHRSSEWYDHWLYGLPFPQNGGFYAYDERYFAFCQITLAHSQLPH